MGSVNISLAGSATSPGYGVAGVTELKKADKESQVKNGTIFAGNMLNMSDNSILMKQEEAKRKAGQVIKQQFAADNEVSDMLEEMRGKIRDLQDETGLLNDQRKVFIDEKEKLKEVYGIAPDSQEQKDLELLEKAAKAIEPGSYVTLTDEEWARVEEMGPATEYQERAMMYNEAADYYSSLIDDANKMIGAYSSAINSVKLGMLEQHGMEDAVAASQEIKDAASGEMIGLLLEEARKKMEEKLEKIFEAAKKAAEKKEASENRLEETKQKLEELGLGATKPDEQEVEPKKLDELTPKLQEAELSRDVILQELDQILDKAKLLDFDKKGLVVNSLI